MHSVTLIFPHQLFKEHPALSTGREVYLIEEYLFFRQYNFHKQKLLLHRASMKYYAHFLRLNGYTAHYIETTQAESDCRFLINSLTTQNVNCIHLADPVDDWLMRRIKKTCAQHDIQLEIYPSPAFLNTMADVNDFFDKKQQYFQTEFYIWQRKKRKILLEENASPAGGKWSFDQENRKKIPKNELIPITKSKLPDDYLTEAKDYIEKHFPQNYGSTDTAPLFAITHDAAEAHLDDFLKTRFEKFGIYEDAILAHEHVLFHSVLSPMLNTGLLEPQQILTKALSAAKQYAIPLNSTEGFIRQIIGWREFIRIVYEREGRHQRTRHFWNFSRKIPASFWQGETGILPLDITIKKVLQTGYCHHIERLMVLGNFMLLCEFDPDDVYRWFMELFIDAYDWVMVPNVYGMTQFADGGLMTTKPYISGSNYIMKMSNYPKGSWQQTWDGLFWRFLHTHRDVFLRNPRLHMLVASFDKMDKAKKQSHLDVAERFLSGLGR